MQHAPTSRIISSCVLAQDVSPAPHVKQLWMPASSFFLVPTVPPVWPAGMASTIPVNVQRGLREETVTLNQTNVNLHLVPTMVLVWMDWPTSLALAHLHSLALFVRTQLTHACQTHVRWRPLACQPEERLSASVSLTTQDLLVRPRSMTA